MGVEDLDTISAESFDPNMFLDPDTGRRELAMMRWGFVPYWS